VLNTIFKIAKNLLLTTLKILQLLGDSAPGPRWGTPLDPPPVVLTPIPNLLSRL